MGCGFCLLHLLGRAATGKSVCVWVYTSMIIIKLLSNFLGPLMSVGLPLMKNVLRQLAKIVSLQLRLTAATSATDASLKKKFYGTRITTPIISIEEMKDIIKIIKSLAESGLLMKSVSDIVENEVKE